MFNVFPTYCKQIGEEKLKEAESPPEVVAYSRQNKEWGIATSLFKKKKKREMQMGGCSCLCLSRSSFSYVPGVSEQQGISLSYFFHRRG